MPTPAESPPETDRTNVSSRSLSADATLVASGASVTTGFAAPSAVGEVGALGPYRVVKELGKGGMGAVYAAVDTRLDRQLALKVMLPQFAADAAAKERFLREARAAAKISHDNVVTVYEADERQGVPYIAMQFLEGSPLDQYLKKKGPPTIPQVLRIAAETAAGLAAAHKLGLVHRDIKPGNLWLEAPHGRVKVLDFGLAKPVDSEFELTKSGAVVGTPAYMSPEQARGEKVDHRTDLFSLGAVLYRLCTGKLPFSGPTTMAVLMALGTEEPPPVREVNPAVPEPLAALIHQLLAKRADARPQSAVEVVKRVRGIAESLAAPRRSSAELSTSQPQLVQPQVVYAVMPVTAASEGSPFADLDSPDTQVASRESSKPDVPEADPKPARKKPGGKGPWVAAGLSLLLAAAVVAGVIIVIKNKDGTETKIEVPDGATVTVKDKDGKTLAQVGPGTKNPPPADTSADRKVAEWVIAQGGTVQVRVSGDDREIGAAANLPREPFTLRHVLLEGRTVSDAGLAHLKDLKALTHLHLGATQVSDAGLAHLKDLKTLENLGLNSTQVSDAGLEHLKELKSLIVLHLNDTKVSGAGLERLKGFKALMQLYLNGTQAIDAGLVHLKELDRLIVLHLSGAKVSDAGLAILKESKSISDLALGGTQVSDAGLERLKELKNLAVLDVQKTMVTAKGAEAFHAAVPGCRIVHNGGTIAPVDVDRKVAEWVIAQGGVVRVNGADKEIKAVAELPKERFTLTVVILNDTKVSDAELLRLKDLKSLTELSLGGTAVSDAGLAHLKEFKGLTHLRLTDTAVTDAGLTHLKGLKEMGAFDLQNTKVTDAGLAHLKEFKSLLYLNLNGTAVSDAGLAHLTEFKSLTYLWLWKSKVSDAGLAHLKELKGLGNLDVRETKMTANGVAALAAALPRCQITHDGGIIAPKATTDVDRKAAEWVIAQGGSVRVNGADKEIKVVAELPNERFALTRVILENTKATDAGLAHLKDCNELMHLSLHRTEVTDAGLAHLKDCKGLTLLNLTQTAVSGAGLEHLKGLTQLYINSTKATDAGLEHLKDLKSLTSLHLVNTKVSDVELAHLKELKKLTSLDVQKTGVTAKGVEALRAALPACQITHDGTFAPKK